VSGSERATRRSGGVRGTGVSVVGQRGSEVQRREAKTRRSPAERRDAVGFRVRVLEVIKTRQGVVGEVGRSSVHEVGALGVLKNLLEGTFHCFEMQNENG